MLLFCFDRPDNLTSVSIMYMQLFFLQESYLDNEREMVCLACVYVAAKVMYNRCKPVNLFVEYHKLKSKDDPIKPVSDQEKAEMETRLFQMEAKLLRIVDFKLNLEDALPGVEYTRRYCCCLL